LISLSSRMLRSLVLFVVVLGACSAVPLQKTKCNMKNVWPPPANHTIRWVEINLDLPPEQRWTAVVKPLAKDIASLVDSVVELFPKAIVDPLLKRFENRSEAYADAMPAPYGAEMKAIAKDTGVGLDLILLYNMFYEILGACTSIVAHNDEGHTFHARNLDFGLFMGIDHKTKTWQLTEKLRPLLFNANFTRGGKVQYQGTFYAGYVGFHTGMKAGAYSISVDTRFDNNYDKYLLQWLEGNHSGHFTTLACRSAMESNATYAEALDYLSDLEMVGPSYVIIGGLDRTEGAIITRAAPKAQDVWTMTHNNNSHFLLQTNYDQGTGPGSKDYKKAPFFDDRRDPGDMCMNELGGNIDLTGLYNVLSAQPNLNQLTTFTALMDVAAGTYESFLQYCPHPCTPW